ncbi:MAG: hypothetical protein KC443_12630, partial [Anaerolineales bacterium]|nr:hypothetical protein [Anaerolineales bacterium]
MRDSTEDLFDLSDDKLALLDLLLEEEGLEAPVVPRILPRPTDIDALPLSYAQQRLWFLEELTPGTATYHIPLIMRVHGAIDPAVLERALGLLMQRHEILRTTFAGINGSSQQVIHEQLPLAIVHTDLRELPWAERGAAALIEVREAIQRPFNLHTGPLLRMHLLQMADDETLLVLVIHHIVFDGWSMGVFFQELSQLYTAVAQNQPNPLPPLALQYADFTLWQRDWLQGEVLAEQMAYWKEQLNGRLPILQLPTDYQRPTDLNAAGASVSFTLSGELVDGLRQVSQDAGCTLFMTLLAAYKLLLYRYSHQTDLLVGVPIANRNQAELETIIGFFVNTIVMRTDLSGSPTFRELLERVRTVALGAYDHQDLPFEQLVAEIQPTRAAGYSPVFQVMFSLEDEGLGSAEFVGLPVEMIEVGNGMAPFDLILSFVATPKEIKGVLEYRADLFAEATVRRMVDHLQNILTAVTVDAERPLPQIPLLSP